jgi:acetyl esterase/lipase
MARDILTLDPPPADFRLSYGGDENQIGELRVPDGSGPHPVVAFVHGGFWRAAYDLRHAGHLCAALTARGYVTWSVEYRRLGQEGGGWPGTFEDVGRAIDDLTLVEARHRLDLSRVVLMGHSAGGHLALWAAARHRLPAEHPLHGGSDLAPRGVVALAGVLDLARAAELALSHSVVNELLGGSPDVVPDRYAAASPYEMLPLGIRQVVVHGDRDEVVPIELSERYGARALALGDPAELVSLPGVDHFAVIDPRTQAWAHVEAAVERAMA